MTIEDAKKAAARAAAALIQSGIVVGLGSGSTAAFFIESLAKRMKSGLFLKAVVASSKHSADLADSLGMPVQDINHISHIDLTVDGADEIDPEKRMIKGGGGAHVREKILASSSRELIVIVDESKLVPALGVCKLPVEILSFGSPATRHKLETLGYKGKWRMNEGSFFISDNGNLIFDVQFDFPPASPEDEHERMKQVPGVVDTGFFFKMAGRVIVGYRDGSVKIQ